MRIDALLVRLGKGSRTQIQSMLRAGRVTLGGNVIKSPKQQVDTPCVDILTVDGEAINTCVERTIVLNKPQGYITANEDRTHETVMELLPKEYKSLECMPIGRLDKDTTGVLLFTTNGELAHRLISPKYHVEKVYVATVDTPFLESDIEAFAQGIVLKDFTALPAKLEIMDAYRGKITLHEGKYHQIKRMLQRLGHQTLTLHRERFGTITLDGLSEGQMRELTKEETTALFHAAGYMINE